MKNNIGFIDTLKGLAILGVVIIHANAQIYVDIEKNNFGPYDHEIITWFSYLSRYCVPLFIMVTGYLYWNNAIELTLKKTVQRVVTPLLIHILWSLVYFLPQYRGEIDYYNVFVLGKTAPQMYYIPAIFIPIVLIMSLVRSIKHSVYSLFILVVLGYLFSVYHPNDEYFLQTGQVIMYAAVGGLFNYLGTNKKRLAAIATLGALGFIGYTVFYYESGILNHINFYSIHIAMFTIAIFACAYLFEFKSKVLGFLGKHSDTIFYQHWLIYIFIYGIWIKNLQPSGIWFIFSLILLFAAVVYLPILLNSFSKIVFKKN